MNKISKFIVASSILLGSAGVYANTSDAANYHNLNIKDSLQCSNQNIKGAG